MGVVLMRKYLLAIERNHNDYVPIAWNLSIVNNNQDINSLREIDKLTSSISEDDLKKQFVSENLLSEEYLEKPLVIIFEENGKTRKLPSGVVTMEEKDSVDSSFIYEFLVNNIRRRQLMNRIYNKFKDKKVSSELKVILEKINSFEEYLIDLYMASLSKLFSLFYEEIRELGLFIKRDLEPLLSEEMQKERTLAMKNKKEEQNGV